MSERSAERSAVSAAASAADALRQRREAAVECESVKRELAVCESTLCAAEIDAAALRAALAAARATLHTETAARSRLTDELAASKREEDRLRASLAHGEAEAVAAAAAARAAESEQRRALEAAGRERQADIAALRDEAAARSAALAKLEACEHALAAAKAEAAADTVSHEAAINRARAEAAAVLDHSAVAADRAASAREDLQRALDEAHAERRRLQEQVLELTKKAQTATSLESLVPSISKILAAIENRADGDGGEAASGGGAAAAAALVAAATGTPVKPLADAPADPVPAPGGGAGAAADALDAASAAFVRAREWEAVASSLRDDVESLEIELAGRPSVRAVRDLSCRVSELEAELAEARREAREPLWAEHKVRRHGSPTREAMRRDKAAARLRWADVETMGPAARDDLLVDVCRALNVSSAHAVRDALGSLNAHKSMAPQLEGFARAVTAIVGSARRADGGEPSARDATPLPQTPRQLLSTLKGWARERTELGELRAFRRSLKSELGLLQAARAEDKVTSALAGPNAPTGAAASAALRPARRGADLGEGGGYPFKAKGGAPQSAKTRAAEAALARLVADAIGDSLAETAAAGGLSSGGVCAALCQMVGTGTHEDALRRVRVLLAAEKEVEAQTVQLALALELRPDATLPQCTQRLYALETERNESDKLFDAQSAKEVLRRLRAHDGVSALAQLATIEAKQAEYRNIFGRFQQQMSTFKGGGGAAAGAGEGGGKGLANLPAPAQPEAGPSGG